MAGTSYDGKNDSNGKNAQPDQQEIHGRHFKCPEC